METKEDMAMTEEVKPKVEESVPQLFQRKVDKLSEKVVIRREGLWNMERIHLVRLG